MKTIKKKLRNYLVVLNALNFMDVLTTSVGLTFFNLRELNPIMSYVISETGVFGFGIIKILYILGLSYLVYKPLYNIYSKRLGWLVVFNVLFGLVVLNNLVNMAIKVLL